MTCTNSLSHVCSRHFINHLLLQEIKSTQVLQSVLNVESKVNNGVPEKVAANEEYLYKPFSVGENGARAKVHTKLTLTGQGKGAGAASKYFKTS